VLQAPVWRLCCSLWRDHSGEGIFLKPAERTQDGAGEKCGEEGVADSNCYQLGATHSSPCSVLLRVGASRGVRNEGLELSLGRRG